MKYWPMAWEAYLRGAYKNPPMSPPLDAPLEIVEQIGAPSRRLYLAYPSQFEWEALDRAGVYIKNGLPIALLDALH